MKMNRLGLFCLFLLLMFPGSVFGMIQIFGQIRYRIPLFFDHVELSVENIRNNGVLQEEVFLQFWATETPYVGAQLEGYRLAESRVGFVSPGQTVSNFTRQEAIGLPPPGPYYLAIVAVARRGGNDVVMDYSTFDETEYLKMPESIGLYHPPQGMWYYLDRGRDLRTDRFGFAGTIPIIGDWDGDGILDYGCYHPPSGMWYKMLSRDGFRTTQFGFAGTIPIVGDWDGDGIDDFGCYHPASGMWFRMMSRSGFRQTQFGFADTIPIVGDWDGDGIDDFGCYHPPSGMWFRMMSRSGFRETQFGFAGTIPIVGDWDGDGRDDFGCFHPPTGMWYRMTSSYGFVTDQFGFAGTIPFSF